jgi:hypothetical protein
VHYYEDTVAAADSSMPAMPAVSRQSRDTLSKVRASDAAVMPPIHSALPRQCSKYPFQTTVVAGDTNTQTPHTCVCSGWSQYLPNTVVHCLAGGVHYSSYLSY